jgi:hypothetical protein
MSNRRAVARPDDLTIPDIVRDFVRRYVHSVAELEGLLLLRHEQGPWNASTLAKRLYVEKAAATMVLAALSRRRLVTHEETGFRYAPQSDALAAAVDALADAYPRFLIPITHLIHSKPSSALHEFADAFKLRDDIP